MTADELLADLRSGDWDYHERAERHKAHGTHPAVAAVLAATDRRISTRKEPHETEAA